MVVSSNVTDPAQNAQVTWQGHAARSWWSQDGTHAAWLKSLHIYGMNLAIRPHNNLVVTTGVASVPVAWPQPPHSHRWGSLWWTHTCIWSKRPTLLAWLRPLHPQEEMEAGYKIFPTDGTSFLVQTHLAATWARTAPPWGTGRLTWPLIGPAKLILKRKNEGPTK